ncbi:uncharacterized protein LOC130922266 isoform X2 [Corythoichthys intestinalis]|uniref:uncharacterized protein LOC130922266 isoform X2 n=1 Tax=Corythoichthys intestinalis TaxID=161448 RepID=UPI0025A5B24A|nr:uncharacterized protein LOC130922266 isoform X2 [Corythoichthys intestinalis]
MNSSVNLEKPSQQQYTAAEVIAQAEIRPIRMVRIRGKLIPMGIFFLRKDGAEVKIVRWREANLPVIEFGQNIAISHLKLKLNMYGMELSTTESTQITETEEVTVRVC